MLSAIQSPGPTPSALQTQRTTASLDNKLANFQQKLSDVTGNAEPGTPSSTAKIQIAQLSGEISGIRHQIDSTQHKAVYIEAAESVAQATQPTYSSHGVMKSNALGSKLNVTA